jgi:lipid II isoglutaminyl synthase (glutamine-hydrolysing)
VGKGQGSVIGGRVALRVAPDVLSELVSERPTVLVTGTNGKSTLTALTVAALAAKGEVVTNATGANMPDGIVTTLATTEVRGGCSVLEVDEVYLEPVVSATRPRVVVVLNALREYTRGISLEATLRHWRDAATALGPECTVLVNVDDPNVVWAFEEAAHVIGVAGGAFWTHDAVLCPQCGSLHHWDERGWSCRSCGRERPEPAWWSERNSRGGWDVVHPNGRTAVSVTMPGRTGPVGATFALAAASMMGVSASAAAEGVKQVVDVDGRYRPFAWGRHRLRLLMLKNPAGWTEAIDAARSTGLPVAIAVDPFGPRDTTTMWEAPFDRLRGVTVPVTGGRAEDVLAVLDAAGVGSRYAPDVDALVRTLPAGEVLVACNYPAFRRLSRLLRSRTA